MLEESQVDLSPATFDVVRKLVDVINRGATAAMFVSALSREHRTLQQCMTGFMLAWFTHLAGLADDEYDSRNEASVRIARKIVAATNGVVNLPSI